MDSEKKLFYNNLEQSSLKIRGMDSGLRDSTDEQINLAYYKKLITSYIY